MSDNANESLETPEHGEAKPVGQLEAEAPRFGTLDWLALRPHVNVGGLELPDVHRVKPGSSVGEYESARCRIIRPDGTRCTARPTRRYGVCVSHAGGGGLADPKEMGRRGASARARYKAERLLLGIGPSGRADVRAMARVAALRRSADLASAIVDGPLDADLGAMAKQTAALRALDATFPLQTATLELEIPANGQAVASLGWSDLQAMAARLLESSSEAGALELEQGQSSD